MRTLRDLYAYNAWANVRVFAACRDADGAQLAAAAPGTFGSIHETLTHMVGVENAYLHMLRGETPAAAMGPREEYYAHDLAWFAERSARLGEQYQELLASAAESFYDEPLHVPWFDFPLTRHDGLLQVLSHSAQHRAQVFSVLGERRQQVPDLDYVLFVQSQRGDH
ncbi:MAG TPA: DinB family protein [Ktedonobacterales bacterium]|nr:DinB family protein [Ktedonobacterales bacterium]